MSSRLPLNRPVWSLVPITFDENDFHVRDFPHLDAFIATANVAGYTLHNILIDIEVWQISSSLKLLNLWVSIDTPSNRQETHSMVSVGRR